jgi:hypothetical protein
VELYERLLKEKEEGERRRGRPPGAFYGSASPVLDRRLLVDAPQDRLPGYRGDLRLLHRYTNEGVRCRGAAMRFASLKAWFPAEHAELAAEAQRQGELLW